MSLPVPPLSPQDVERLRVLGLQYGLPPTTRVLIDLYNLKKENAQLRAGPMGSALNSLETGPWDTLGERSLISDDFEHDVKVVFDGDFISDTQRKDYRDRLLTILNLGTAALNEKLLNALPNSGNETVNSK